jgi:RNA polymerase sigma factor for flagellar operon FliA
MKSARQPTSALVPSREELAAHMPLVHQVVARVLRRLPPNVLREDLVAAGTMGLLDALRKSEARGAAFEWYARVRIRGAVMDELRAEDWLTRRNRARVARDEASGIATPTSVVGFDDLPQVEAQGFEDERAPNPHEQVQARLNRMALESAVSTLPEREANIVRWHYFEGVDFKDIARRFGVSEPRISQLHSRAMTLLRGIMAEKPCAAAAA